MSSLRLASLEIKRLLRNRIIRVALVGICMMPLLYSFLYLYAFWDPYGRLKDLPVAFVNEDRGALLAGQSENFGSMLADKLKENTDVKWEFVKADEASEGLESGRYYVTLRVPEDFSARILSAQDELPQAADLIFETNQSKNFLAVEIGRQVASEIQAQVTQEVNGKFYQQILASLQDGAGQLQQAADGAQKLADGSAEALNGVQALQAGTKELRDGVAQLGTGANELNQGAGRLAAGVSTAGGKVAEAGQGAAQLDSGLASAKQASGQLAQGIGGLTAGADQLSAGADDLAGGLSQLQGGLADQQKGIPALEAGMGQVQQGTAQLAQGMNGGVGEIRQGAEQSAAALSQAQALLQKYLQFNPAAAQNADYRMALGVVDGTRQALAYQMLPGIDQLSSQAGEGFTSLSQGEAQVAAGLGELQSQTGAALDQLTAGADRLNQGAGALSAGAKQAQTGVQQLSGGLSQLSDGANRLAAGLSDPSGFQQLQTGAGALADGAAQLSDGTAQLGAGLGELQAGEDQLAQGLTQLGEGNATLATKLTEAVEKMQDQAKGDPEARGKALASPVNVQEVGRHNAPDYGTGFTPYFVPLALWVGALLLFFVVRTREMRLKTSLLPVPHLVLSKFFTLAVLGTIQAVISSWVLLTFLPLHPQSVPAFYGFNILMSWTFIAIMQFLVSALGTVGRFVSIVLLMLQLTSCGGTFPMELVPRFFQVINPFVPMTYATAGLRQIISGSAAISLSTSVLVMVGFLVGSIGLTMLTESRFVRPRDLDPAEGALAA